MDNVTIPSSVSLADLPGLSRVARFVNTHPIAKRLVQFSEAAGCEAFLWGGALRDLLLDQQFESDADFILSIGERPVDSVEQELREALANIPESEYAELEDIEPGFNRTSEIKFHPEASDYVLGADFTVHALLYELKTGELVDCSGRGLDDLANRRLHLNTRASTLQIPLRRLFRPFRLAAEQGFSLSAATSAYIEETHPFLGTLSDYDRAAEAIEFFRLISQPRFPEVFLEVWRSGVLTSFFPELLGFQANGIKGLIARLERLEQVREKLSKSHRERLLMNRRIAVDFPEGAAQSGHSGSFNELGLIRISLLFYGLSDSLPELLPRDNPYFQSGKFLSNLPARFLAGPQVAEVFKRAFDASMKALKDLSAGNVNLSAPSEPHEVNFALLVSAVAGEGVSQKIEAVLPSEESGIS